MTPEDTADGDTTVLLARKRTPSQAVAPSAVDVAFTDAQGERHTTRYTSRFRVGRGKGCAVRIDDMGVSRQHVEIYPAGGGWWARDLRSSNGTYLNGLLVRQIELKGTTTLELGTAGSLIQLSLASAFLPPGEQASSQEEIAQHYFAPAQSGPAGEHTLLVRQAFERVRRQQSRRDITIVVIVLVLLLAGGLAVYHYHHSQAVGPAAKDLSTEHL